MPREELMELGWGLANSNQFFLWVIRPDLVMGETTILEPEFMEVIKERGLLLVGAHKSNCSTMRHLD